MYFLYIVASWIQELKNARNLILEEGRLAREQARAVRDQARLAREEARRVRALLNNKSGA